MSLTKVSAVAMWILNDKKGRTIRYRLHGIDNLAGSPPLEETELELVERKIGNHRRFWNWG